MRPDLGTVRLLLVEPDDVARDLLATVAAPFAEVASHGRFESARESLLGTRFDFLVANVRLGAYNGLHLVYLSVSGEAAAPRSIVYSHKHDPGLAREIQQAGAFYEVGECLPFTLAAYLLTRLPSHDRRVPVTVDRRTERWGGRRRCDVDFNPCALRGDGPRPALTA